jgi:hypothetical protein
MSKRKNEDRGRYTARRKVEAVVLLLKGEDLDRQSRELGVTAAMSSRCSGGVTRKLAGWEGIGSGPPAWLQPRRAGGIAMAR